MPGEPKPADLSDLRRKLSQVERLAAMPQVVWQLVEALSDDNTSAKRLEELIESDLALSARVLSLANSAYYSPIEKITTISRAVVLIGFNELHLLVLGAGLAEVFDLKKTPASFKGLELWAHNIAVSWAARQLAVTAGYPSPAEMMVAGLMHDLGKLLFCTHLAEEYSALLTLTDQGLPFYQAEDNLGLRHTEIGYWLASKWGLPQVHLDIIRKHHRPNPKDPNIQAIGLVNLADSMVKYLGFGLVQKSPPVGKKKLVALCGLKADDVRGLTIRAKTELPKIFERWRHIIADGEFLGNG